jgi:uncharacterized protein
MIPLRLVLDTNVVVSAALKPDGQQRTVFLLGITKPALLYMSPEILQEYREVLSRPELQIRKSLRNQFLALLKKHARLVHPSVQIHMTQDPDDNLFLECADAARADYLVTGNARHFPSFWKKTKIITSREFVELVAPHLVS